MLSETVLSAIEAIRERDFRQSPFIVRPEPVWRLEDGEELHGEAEYLLRVLLDPKAKPIPKVVSA